MSVIEPCGFIGCTTPVVKDWPWRMCDPCYFEACEVEDSGRLHDLTLVPSGAIHEDHLGLDMSLLTYVDGIVRFRHLCDRGPRGVIICAPALQLGNGHTLTRREDGAATVRASVLCDDCGTHGFVTDGRWESC